MKFQHAISIMLSMLSAVCLSACTDKAEPKYAECIASDAKGDVNSAWEACVDAVRLDPNGRSGKAAADKLKVMRPAHDEWLKQREQQAALDADRRRQAHAQAAAAMEAKVSRRRNRIDDVKCLSDGHPPNGYVYEGGTYAENEAIALAKGCIHGYTQYPGQPPVPMSNYYCCPR